MKISEHLDLYEIIRSDSAKRLGISNMPTDEHLANIKQLAEHIFEPIRNNFRCPINVSSVYRSKELNDKTPGSAKNSQHCLGEAMDIDMDGTSNGVTNKMVFDYIKANLPFDQMIWEHGDDKNPAWVHVSYTTKKAPRKEILKAFKVDGVTKYAKF